MILPVLPLEKAFGRKDYSRLVEKHGVDKNGKPYSTWVLPEEAGQQSLFGESDGGKANNPGNRGYLDHVDEETHKTMVEPLVKTFSAINPDLSKRMKYKYEQYRFDRETKELDLKVDMDIAWYMKKIKAEPEYKKEWQEEFDQKVGRIVSQINNRKMAMAKIQKGSQVKFRGQYAVVADFDERRFPIVRTQDGEHKAFWEEIFNYGNNGRA
jgi:hypothetical protein